MDVPAAPEPSIPVAPVPSISVPSKSAKPIDPTEIEGTTPEPEAPYVVLSGLAATRYNGRIGQILYPVTDEKGVARWAVRLSLTESIRVPVDNCTRVTEGEVVKWELDGRRAAHRAELEANGEPEKVFEEEVDTSPFPTLLHNYVLAMDSFFRTRLTTGEDVQIHAFATLFSQFETDVCKAVVHDVGDTTLTEKSAYAALNVHMTRSARYTAACGRYIRIAEDDTTPTTEVVEGAESVEKSFAKAMLDDGDSEDDDSAVLCETGTTLDEKYASLRDKLPSHISKDLAVLMPGLPPSTLNSERPSPVLECETGVLV